MTHNMHSLILGWINWDRPHQRIYVYPDGTNETFKDILKVTVLRTGCHVLEVSDSKQYVILPGWRYIVQEAQ